MFRRSPRPGVKLVYEPPEASATRVLVNHIWAARTHEGACQRHAAVKHLMDLVSTGKVTMLFGAHDTERTNAVALADYLAAH